MLINSTRKLWIMMLPFVLCLSACHTSKTTVQGDGNDSMETKKSDPNGVPVIQFETPLYDFGDVVKGETRKYAFDFVNTGNGDLIIELATACTCTSIDWPRQPIPPGGKGSIPIVFDSSTKDGEVTIDVDIISNTKPIVVTAQFKANVISKTN